MINNIVITVLSVVVCLLFLHCDNNVVFCNFVIITVRYDNCVPGVVSLLLHFNNNTLCCSFVVITLLITILSVVVLLILHVNNNIPCCSFVVITL